MVSRPGEGTIARLERGRQATDQQSVFRLNILLLLPIRSVRLRAMFRIVILFISVVWASLLLISWGGASPAPQAPQTVISSTDRP